MKGTLFFVHGTGVRREGYDKLCEALKAGLKKAQMDVTFAAWPWGVEMGVKSDRVPDTLPQDVEVYAVDAPPTDEEIELTRWTLLATDPLVELRVVAQSAGGEDGAPDIAVDVQLPEQVVRGSLQRLVADSPDLTETGLSPAQFQTAVDTLLQNSELVDNVARLAGGYTDPELSPMLARAIVAISLSNARLDRSDDLPAIAFSGTTRDALVTAIANKLAPQTYDVISNLVGKAKSFLVGQAATLGTRLAVDNRLGLTGRGTGFAADIVYYLKRGNVIRERLAQKMDQLEQPVVAVGHSLGGIMLVDLLSQATCPKVSLLVTAGSQSPVLLALDSLDRLRLSDNSVKPYTPWLNIYNRNDLLAFCAEKIFSNLDGIEDVEVNPGVPFPEAHSAYWHCDEVFELIKDRWPES